MAGVAKKGGKKNRKYGRNKVRGQAVAYSNEGRKRKNQLRKLKRHIKYHPEDVQAEKSLQLIGKGSTGVKPKRVWVRKWKYKGDVPMMYRERING